MRTSSTLIPKPLSPSKASSSSSSSSVSSSEAARYRPPLIRTNSVERERVTIASIAPTILKTTDVSDEEDGWPGSLAFDSNDATAVHERERIDSASTPVELVYVPPLGSNYEIQREDGESEDAYHDRELIFNFGEPVSFSIQCIRSTLPHLFLFLVYSDIHLLNRLYRKRRIYSEVQI
jgi:hypothetical protein